MPQPSTDQYIQVGSIHTRFRSAGGSGLPLLMLHGITRSLEDFSHNLKFLGQTHRAYALDMVGYGKSDKPALEYAIADLVNHVKGFMDTQGLEGAVLMGCSLGGAVALQLALEHPQKVRALVLIGCAGFGPEVTLGLRLSTLPWLGEYLSRASREGCTVVLKELFHDPSFVTSQRVEHDYAMAQEPGRQAAFLRNARQLGNFWGVRADWRKALTQRLPQLQVPVLVVWGQQDHILPVKHLEAVHHLLPTAQVQVFDPCGHFPQLERSAEFNRLVGSFLGGLEGGAGLQ